MIKLLKELVTELKRANDIKEKELDLKILGPFDYQEKWGVYPTQPITTTPHVVVAPTHESHATSSMMRYPW